MTWEEIEHKWIRELNNKAPLFPIWLCFETEDKLSSFTEMETVEGILCEPINLTDPNFDKDERIVDSHGNIYVIEFDKYQYPLLTDKKANLEELQLSNSKIQKIDELVCFGHFDEVKKIFETEFSQYELDFALCNAIACNHLELCDYFIELGGKLSFWNYYGVKGAAENGYLPALKYAISKGVDINISDGAILNLSLTPAMNSKSIEIIEWILEQGADKKYIQTELLEVVRKFGNNEINELFNDL